MDPSPNSLISLCIAAAASSAAAVETWRRQRRTLERLPAPLADALLRRLLHNRLLYPSLLEVFQRSVEEVDLKGEGCVDAEWLAYLGAFRYLRRLCLADCKGVTDSAIWPLSGISNSGGNTSEKAFSLNMLRYLRYLESLNLEETPLSDEAVRPLASLTQLRSLYLKSDFLSEVSLHALSSLTELKHLGFRGAVLTNSGLLLYKPPPLLCLLDLRGCWLLGSEGVSSFSMEHLAIQVKHEYLPVSDPKSGACSSSQEITRASPLGHKGLGFKKAAKFPDRTKVVSFVDERLKYSREELLELQLSQIPNISLHDIPELLRKE